MVEIMVEVIVISGIMIAVSILIGTVIGMVIGQHSVWRHLRKKGQVIIDDWEYSARRL